MSDLLWLSTLMVVGAVVLVLWTTRNLFAPLSVAVILMIPVFVGCVMVSETDPRGVRLAFLTATGILCSALGGLVARRWFRHNPAKELAAFRAQRPQRFLVSGAMFSMALYSFIALGIFLVVIFFVRAGVPLLSGDVFVGKVEAARAGGYLSVRFMRLYLPLLVMIYFVGSGAKVRRNRFVIGLTGFFILVVFTLFGYRSYVLNYFLVPMVLLLAYQRVSKRVLFFLGAAAFGSGVGITAFAYRESSFRSLWDVLSHRLFVSGVVEGLGPVVYQLVPTYGYLYGQGFWMDVPAVLSRLGIGPPRVENFAQFLSRIQIGENIYGWQAAPTLTGEAYANFGMPGIVIIMFAFGFLMHSLYIRTLRGPKDVLLLPISVYLQLSLLIACGGPFVFTLIDMLGALVLFAGIFLFLYIFWSLPFGGPRFSKALRVPRQRPGIGVPARPG